VFHATNGSHMITLGETNQKSFSEIIEVWNNLRVSKFL